MFDLARGKRQFSREPVSIEGQGARGQFGDIGRAVEIVVEKRLQPLIGGAKITGEQSILFAAAREKGFDQFSEFLLVTGRERYGAQAEVRKFQVQIPPQLRDVLLGGVRWETNATSQIHRLMRQKQGELAQLNRTMDPISRRINWVDSSF